MLAEKDAALELQVKESAGSRAELEKTVERVQGELQVATNRTTELEAQVVTLEGQIARAVSTSRVTLG